jgi:hypothetical protein
MKSRAEKSMLRRLAEILFSINTGFAATSVLFCVSFSACVPFIHLEVYLNHLLGIRQTDFIRGHFTIWIPALILATCIWTLLQFLSRLPFAPISQLLSGVTILLCPTAIWTCRLEPNGWSLQWPYKTVWGETLLAIICLLVFLKGPWATSRWIGLSAFLGHSVFWYWFEGNGFRLTLLLNWEVPGYEGPAGMGLGFGSLLIWGLCVYRVRNARSELPVSSDPPHASF